MKITVVGLEYEGGINAVGLSFYLGEIFALDFKKKKVEAFRRKEVTYNEPYFTDYLDDATNKMRITTEVRDAVINANVLLFADEAFIKNNDDLSLFYDYIDKIVPFVSNDITLVIRFTLPIGMSQKIKEYVEVALENKYDVTIVYSPNFFARGEAVSNMMKPSRIVAGISSLKARDVTHDLFSKFPTTIIYTSLGSAEISKYASDSFLAIKLSYFNSIANICPIFKADAEEVRMAVALDKRIGRKYTGIGIGFGGDELSSHAEAFYEQVKLKSENELILIKEALEVNRQQPLRLVDVAYNFLGTFKGMKIAILGLTFKPNVPSITGTLASIIIRELTDSNAKVYCYDPRCNEEFQKLPHGANVKFTVTPLEALTNADACFILTAEDEFKEITADTYINYMKNPNIFDGRNIYTRKSMTGTNYFSIGRKTVLK